ncbi:MAG: hypothetical protein KDK78_11835, partial [Chlamydiia bacterium]|nr:hypothetical protein [Chlamydiia bacterium]
ITHMRPEDLLRPHVDGKTYLEQAMRAGKIEIADALRQHMDPQQFTQLAADLYHEAPDDDWKLLLTPMTHTKGAGV